MAGNVGVGQNRTRDSKLTSAGLKERLSASWLTSSRSSQGGAIEE